MSTRGLDQQAQELFLEAADREGDDQDRFLDQRCGSDTPLRRQVDDLLETSAQAERYFGELAERAGLDVRDAEEVAGQLIGPYRIISLIGRGGMGAVYLGERADQQYEKRVAIKVLPLGLEGSAARARFLAERQILAGLDHPGIAKLLDGGVNREGSPYFVMEYIEGLPIDVYCDRHRLDISARLRLFCQVCDAVGFAHRKLVVHRDLKPGNVLVTADEEAKLLDFGIAKLLDQEAPQLTRAGVQPMTPRYTSPEVLSGQAISTASDVYSLGVLLYELLAGVSPYGNPGGATTLATLRAALESPVPLASVMVRRQAGVDGGPASRQAAEARGTTPERLERRLRGDLDTVVLTALRIEPEQRYESAAQLAADIRRSEEQLPITARAPTLAYTARKFLARHTAAVTAAAVAVLALVATAGVATYYGVTTERQSRTIIQERDRAEQTQKFLLSIFEEADPNEARGAEITAKELLGRGAQRIDEELAGQPDAQAILKATIGHVYVVLGLYHEARPQLEDAAAFFRSAQGETSAAYAEVLDQLAELAEIEGDYPAALALAERALEASEKAGDPAGIARDSTRTGRVLHLMGKLDEAEAHYQRGLDIYIGLYGENNAAVAQSLSHFGGLMTHLNRLDEAESLHRRSLVINRALHGDDHLASIESMINLGWVLNKQEKYEQALAMLNNALALNLRLLGPDHRDNSFIYNHRAHAQKGLGNYAAAEADFLRSRDIVEQQLGRSHPNYGIATGNIGKMLVIQEDFVGAEPYLREAREVLSTALPDHWMTHDIEFRLGTTLSELDRYADAEVYLRASVTGLSDKRGQYGDIIREATASLIEVLELQNKTSEAERYRTLLNDTEHRAEKNSAADAPGPLN